MGVMDFFSRRDDGRAGQPGGTFNPKAFFDHCRLTVMGPTLDQNEVQGAEAILEAMRGLPLSWVAYALATAWHETAHTMKPIREHGSEAYFRRMYDVTGNRPALARKMGNTKPGDGVTFCGRGYVQLTWRCNYRLAGAKLNKPLEAQPHLAMQPDIAAAIMRHGMVEGWFTGKAFRHYLPAVGLASKTAFTEARRIINGTDKAALIAGYALDFQKALAKASWA
jgi:putative chitinase